MNSHELFFKTAFCCMACDGKIANEEVVSIKKIACETDYFQSLDIDKLANSYVEKINEQGYAFLESYLNDLKETKLSEHDQLALVKIAIRTIEADEQIQYQEISFFKQIRACLTISDDAIMEMYPERELDDMETYFLPDIVDKSTNQWSTLFSSVNFSMK